MPLPEPILDILRTQLKIDSEKHEISFKSQIDPGQFQQVVDIFTRFGAKYKGKKASNTGRYAFNADPAPMIEVILTTGEANPLAFFSTPNNVADYLAVCLSLETMRQGGLILEPSFGTGKLYEAVLRRLVELGRVDPYFTGVEINSGLVKLAQRRKTAVVAHDSVLASPLTIFHDDFTLWRPPGEARYDRIIMNPPFTETDDRSSYIWHITRAWTFLKQDGLLVAVAPPGWTFQNRGKDDNLPMFFDEVVLKPQQFRRFVETYGHYVELRPGLFNESGTNIGTTVILLGKTKPDSMPAAPAELLKPPLKEPEYEDFDLKESLVAIAEAERKAMIAQIELRQMLAGLLGETGPVCTYCGCPFGSDVLQDLLGQYWHVGCAQLVLSGWQKGEDTSQIEN